MSDTGASLAFAPRSGEPGEAGCRHCGLPIPTSRLGHGAGAAFCCDGCSTVYAVLHREGLELYYELRERSGASGRRAATTGADYRHFDDPKFRELYCRAVSDGVLETELYLEGVHCSACLWLIERTSAVIPGVAEVRLDLARSVARVVFEPAHVELGDIARRLDSLGYASHPHRGHGRHELRLREDRALLARIGVAGAAAGNVMLAAAALYGGRFSGIAPDHEQLFRWVSLAVTTPAVLWSGAPFFRGALGALKTGTAHMDQPIALGISAGYAWGLLNTLRGHGDLYFDSVTALVFLLLVGRLLQRRQHRKASDAAELLSALSPSNARVVEGEHARAVHVDAVPSGAVVEVRSGESIPVDGVVVDGSSRVDTALLTGESRPERVGPGDRVHAGCINLSGMIRLRATAAGAATRMGQLVARMQDAARRRAPVVRLADSLSGWFVKGVLAAALSTLLVWLFLDPSRAVDHTVALLVVSCPCALGLATPLAISAALGHAARGGILVKGGDALEALARPALVVFDKTGTLTSGKLELVEWVGDRAVMPLVRAAETRSAHPIARAVLEGIPEAPAELDRVEERPGAGLTASHRGTPLLVGSPAFVRASVEEWPAWVDDAIATAARAARSPVLVALDGQVRAVASLGDPVRDDARASLERLRALGCELAVLSGDHPDVVAAVARELGVPLVLARGGVGPEAKLAFIEAARARGRVVMVGDGANDAAALSAATVGVAVHGGAEASLAAADVFATRGGLDPVVKLMLGARRTLRVIRRNIGLSLIYNVVGVSLAAAGWLDPLIAALLMPLSSITVIASSYRARTFAVVASNPAPAPPSHAAATP